MLLIIVLHLACASVFQPLFAAHLNIHLCFAVFATQVRSVYCYSLLDAATGCHLLKNSYNIQVEL